METEALGRVLECLEVQESASKNTEITALFERTRSACQTLSGSRDMIRELEDLENSEFDNEKSPFYFLLLAYAQDHMGNTDLAVDSAEMAIHRFNGMDRDWHRAMAGWFLGILLHRLGDLTQAAHEIKNALAILRALEAENQRQGFYDKYKDDIEDVQQSLAGIATTITPKGDFILAPEVMACVRVPRGSALLEDWRQAMAGLTTSDSAPLESHINSLNSMLQRKNEYGTYGDPFVHVFLSHCYNLLSYEKEGQFEHALQFAWKAVKDFRSGANVYTPRLNRFNHAITRWYLGLLYESRADIRSCRFHLESAKLLLEGLLGEYRQTAKTARAREIEVPLGSINQWLHFGRHAERAYTPKPKDENEVDTQRPLRAWFPRSKQDVNSHPAPGENGTRNGSTAAHTISPSFWPEPSKTKTGSLGAADKPLPTTGSLRMGIYVPSFPIYGQITEKEPYLPDSSALEKAPPVSETFRLILDGKEYSVFLLERDAISDGATREYGWFRVSGRSMNNTHPIPIEDCYYVLFVQNPDTESCIGKIVLAIVQDFETDRPQIVVRRLLKSKSPFSIGSNLEIQYAKYSLHSESTFDKDPKTGESYRSEIKLLKDEQVVGEVVAIARPGR
ncbi:MAG: hypothetical protein AB1649_05745 [Chloroflexota bacterium]